LTRIDILQPFDGVLNTWHKALQGRRIYLANNFRGFHPWSPGLSVFGQKITVAGACDRRFSPVEEEGVGKRYPQGPVS
jgi:hypothetical protein